MVNFLGAVGGGVLGGAAITIVIRAVDKFTNTFAAANAGLMKLGAGITAVGVAGGFAVGGLLKMAGQFEQTEIAFTTMLGSAETANKLLKELADFAKKTPFTITGVEGTAKMLLAMSIELDKLKPSLKSLGDVSSGLNVPMERLALNFGQVKVQGKLTGRELRDFAIAGVPLVAELAKNLNVTEAEIKDMVSAGEIGFQEVEDAFTSMTSEGGKFFNLMDAQSKTFLGQISNIQDSFITVSRAMGKVFLPAAKFVAEHLAKLIGWFEEHPKIAKFTAIFLGVATAGALIIGPLLIILGLLPLMITGFGVLTAVTLPMTLTVLAIAAAITALIIVGTKLWKKWDELSKKAKLFAIVLAPMISIPILILKHWKELKIGLASIWNELVRLTAIGVNFFIKGINKIIDAKNRVFGTKTAHVGDVTFGSALIDIEAIKTGAKAQEEVTEQIVAQNAEMQKQMDLVAKLKHLRVIPSTGDIFDPSKALVRSDFQTREAYEQAVLGVNKGFSKFTEINIENVVGLDPQEISRALKDELYTKIRL